QNRGGSVACATCAAQVPDAGWLLAQATISPLPLIVEPSSRTSTGTSAWAATPHGCLTSGALAPWVRAGQVYRTISRLYARWAARVVRGASCLLMCAWPAQAPGGARAALRCPRRRHAPG